MDIRVRFAPSPTGNLHIGGLRTALFNFLFAKKNGGKFLIRLEDTDLLRSRKEYEDSIFNSLKKLEIFSDEEVLIQSKRFEIYNKISHKLLKSGSFYESEEHDENGNIGKVIKCKVEKKNRKEICFYDLIRGSVSFPINEIEDFIVIRSNGSPLYNFVVVVDDIFMKISHVIRGEEHLSNTPRQIILYEALGEIIPQFAHLPLILGSDGKKLSKRDSAVAVDDYFKIGIVPEALLSYLVRLGWSYGDKEIFTLDEMMLLFEIEKVHQAGAIFDIKKLNWVNEEFLRKNLTNERILNLISSENLINKSKDGFCFVNIKDGFTESEILQIINFVRKRVTTIFDVADSIKKIICFPENYNICNCDFDIKIKPYLIYLIELINVFNIEHFNSVDSLKKVLLDFCSEKRIEQHNIFTILRFSIYGVYSTPAIIEIMKIIGYKRVFEKINKFVNFLEKENGSL
jgi:glutamyl-tRNA synthetase